MSSKEEARMTLSPPPSTIFCRFCNAVISFRAATTEKFKMHMESVHEIYLDLDFLLSIHFIKEEEKTSMVKATRSRMLNSVRVLVGADVEGEAEVGELAFVPKGSRLVSNVSTEVSNVANGQLDSAIGMEEDKVQVVEVNQ